VRPSRAGRSSTDIFNFSFLDVFACTAGMVLFVIIMLVISAISSVPLVDRERFNHARTLARQLAVLQADERINPDASRLWIGSSEELNQLLRERESLADYENTLREAVFLRELEKTLTDQIAQAAALEQRVNALKAEKAERRIPETLHIRKPALRPTTKNNQVTLTFDNNEVRFAHKSQTSASGFSSPHFLYNYDPDLEMFRVVPVGRGYRVDQVMQVGGEVSNYFKRMNTRLHIVHCIVTPTGFDAYIQVREALYESGYEVSTDLLEDLNGLVIGRSDRRLVQ
jgi:hypothetical protein